MTVRRYYTENDLARIACISCEGCGECCRGMGDTIVLDPWDACHLSRGLGRPFPELLSGGQAGLHNDCGIILPHLAMREGACSFLGGDGRCRIHSFRPGICRLYPLAREYGSQVVRYFILPDACSGRTLSKTRISRHLGIPDLKEYEAFKLEWFHFTKDVGEQARKAPAEQQKAISLFLLETFYLMDYRSGDFYTLFGRRLRIAKRKLLAICPVS